MVKQPLDLIEPYNRYAKRFRLSFQLDYSTRACRMPAHATGKESWHENKTYCARRFLSPSLFRWISATLT